MVGGHFAQLESDMWSLGVMLFMMLSGGLSPFWAGNDYKTSARVVAGDFRSVVRPPASSLQIILEMRNEQDEELLV